MRQKPKQRLGKTVMITPFCIAKQMTNINNDVIGDTSVNNVKGCVVFKETEVESVEGALLNEQCPCDSNHVHIGSR